ncbi:MAG: dienelactone hydrolase family protein, partial [Bacillota bacterium]|nr:dienelactone hydrolase family protein [Bacillota bacterium]
NYKHVFLLGFSVGATAAWICSEKEPLADGVICYYGSRIRDFQNTTPKCPILLIFAKEEKSFDVLELSCALKQKQFVDAHVLNGKHGFSDPFSKCFNQQSQQIAQNLVDSFLLNLKC